MNSADIITLHELSQDNSNTPSKRDVYSKLYAKLNNFHDEYFVIDFDESYGVDLRANFIDTLQLTEQGYNEFVKLASNHHKTDNLDVFTAHDVSGYNYWTELQEETNYLHLTVALRDNCTNFTQADLDSIWDIMNDISREYDSIVYNHSIEEA